MYRNNVCVRVWCALIAVSHAVPLLSSSPATATAALSELSCSSPSSLPPSPPSWSEIGQGDALFLSAAVGRVGSNSSGVDLKEEPDILFPVSCCLLGGRGGADDGDWVWSSPGWWSSCSWCCGRGGGLTLLAPPADDDDELAPEEYDLLWWAW